MKNLIICFLIFNVYRVACASDINPVQSDDQLQLLEERANEMQIQLETIRRSFSTQINEIKVNLSKIDRNCITKDELYQEVEFLMPSIANKILQQINKKLSEDDLTSEERLNITLSERNIALPSINTLKVNVQNLFRMNKVALYNARPPNKIQYLYGAIEEAANGHIRISKFETTPPPNATDIDFEFYLRLKEVVSVIPSKAFFKFYRKEEYLGEVIISVDIHKFLGLNALTPRGVNFLLLASGLKGTSYKGSVMRETMLNNYIYGGYTSDGNRTYTAIPSAVEEDFTDGGLYAEKYSLRGYVEGYEAKDKGKKNDFFITREAAFFKTVGKFAEVSKGMDVADMLIEEDWIKDCGFII